MNKPKNIRLEMTIISNIDPKDFDLNVDWSDPVKVIEDQIEWQGISQVIEYDNYPKIDYKITVEN